MAQLAPAGYTAAFNTPTADVLTTGGVAVALSNANPERGRLYPGVGATGSLNLGFGPLPGLELVTRLAFEGDLHCAYWDSGCRAGLRDLSASAKYQLPWRVPLLDLRLAVGASDYGGAATNFRQTYAVASADVAGAQVSVGYSRAESPLSLMSGAFGSVILPLGPVPGLSLGLESDSREWRAGARYRYALSSHLDLGLSLSRKITDHSVQPGMQAGAMLTWYWGGRSSGSGADVAGAVTPRAGMSSAATASALPRPVPLAVRSGSVPDPAAAQVPDSGEARIAEIATNLAARLRVAGFASVSVAHAEGGVWWVQAEPLHLRQSRQHALGVALAQWLALAPEPDAVLVLTLNWLGQPVGSLQTRTSCLKVFVHGSGQCVDADLVGWWSGAVAAPAVRDLDPTTLRTLVLPETPVARRAQFEFGPALRNTLGTEYALADYSLALNSGVELPLARGLLFQGNLLSPIVHSGNYADGRVFSEGRYRNQLETARLSYWMPLPWGLAAQASGGLINHSDQGGQLDFLWMSPEGRWRASASVGRYRTDLDTRLRQPALGSVRYSVIPGSWHLEATVGQFYNNDVGARLSSIHWFGDRSISFYYRDSRTLDSDLMPRRRFAGFHISLPLGPASATVAGPVTVRGSDRWSWGLESKVGAADNVLTGGYGVVPRLRHGLLTDGIDHDRAGRDDFLASVGQLKDSLRRALAD